MLEKIRPYLPSKKILLLLGICIVVVGGVVFIANFDSVKTVVAKHQAKKELGTGSVSDFITQDSDGDTIPDWEEPLWGTDPNNPDTNGDGVSDGDEVEEKRLALQQQTGTSVPTELNQTQKLAREFFSVVTSLANQGALTDEAMQNLATSFVEQTQIDTELPDLYTQSDIKITYASDSKVINNYHSALEKILMETDVASLGIEMQVIASGIYLGDTSRIQNLTIPAQTYKDIASALMQVTVPVDAISRHLAVVNAFAHTGQALDQITQISNDPLVGIPGVVLYSKSTAELIDALNSLGIYFESHDIL